jgi:hypothetical protein
LLIAPHLQFNIPFSVLLERHMPGKTIKMPIRTGGRPSLTQSLDREVRIPAAVGATMRI